MLSRQWRGAGSIHLRHRSRQVTERSIEVPDLILTAELDHVIKIAAISPSAYRRSMTMPEFLELAAQREAPAGIGLRGLDDGTDR